MDYVKLGPTGLEVSFQTLKDEQSSLICSLMNKLRSFNHCKYPVSVYNYRRMFINVSIFIFVGIEFKLMHQPAFHPF
jgi:hypothetical protein